MKTKSIQELAETYLKTETEKDFVKLYERIRPGLLNHCRNIVLDPDIAEDALSNTLCKIWTKSYQYDPERANFSTWCYNIARNEAILLLKTGGKYVSMPFESDTEGSNIEGNISLQDYDSSGIVPSEMIIQEEQRIEDLYNDVIERLYALPPIYKDILIDREINKMRYKEIAEKYQMNKRAVSTRIRRARISIRKMFPGVKLNFSE
jgi:RNA polymerase sigma-70 factor (ECF subfamily)